MAYTEEQRKKANQIKKKIIRAAGGSTAVVYINVVYLTCFELENDEPLLAEIPVLIARSDRNRNVFFDAKAIEYESAKKLIMEIGKCFSGGMVYPEQLSYCSPMYGKKVQLVYSDSTGSTPAFIIGMHAERILTSTASLLGVATIVCSLPISAGFQCAAMTRTAASYLGVAATCCAITSSAIKLGALRGGGTDEELVQQTVMLVSISLVNSYQVLKNLPASETSCLQSIRTSYQETFKKLFVSMRTGAIYPAVTAVAIHVYRLFKKKGRSMRDVCDLSLSLFSLFNVYISAETIEQILDMPQMGQMSRLENDIQ
ncbi:hypothetical protein PENTCL1PPCAC_4027, partial [Pristionchus entomophagus]